MKIREIFARLSKPTAADDVREIEALLAKIDTEAAEARATLAGLAKKRTAALRDDDDRALDGIDAAKLTAERVIEKAGLARPEVVERLAAARVAAKEAARAGFKKRQVEIAGRLAAALKAAEACNRDAEALDLEIRASLGDHSGLPAIVFGGTLLRGGPDAWHLYIEREFGHLPTPPSTRPAEKPKVVTKPAPTAKPTRAPKPKPVLAETPVDGWRRMVVLKSGYESPEGLALAAGELVDVPESEAKKAAERGAVDYAA